MNARLIYSGGAFYIEKDRHVASGGKIEYAERNSISVARSGLAVRKVSETYDVMEGGEEELGAPLIFIEIFECIIKERSSVVSLDFDFEPLE